MGLAARNKQILSRNCGKKEEKKKGTSVLFNKKRILGLFHKDFRDHVAKVNTLKSKIK